MAGDWIKMQKSLPRAPKVIRIASALGTDRLRTVGGLFSAWCLFDEQTEDGILTGYTPELFDEIVGLPGMARAMESVEWLEIGQDFLVVPRFDEHNGASAKRRAQDRDRKQSTRQADKCPAPKRTDCGLEKNRAREELSPPLPPEGKDEGERELIRQVKSLRPEWQGSEFLDSQQRPHFDANRRQLEAFVADDWQIQREFFKVRPSHLAKEIPEKLWVYLQSPERTNGIARDWKRKQRPPSGPLSRSPSFPQRAIIPREKFAEMVAECPATSGRDTGGRAEAEVVRVNS